jgi:hypothetical protein
VQKKVDYFVRFSHAEPVDPPSRGYGVTGEQARMDPPSRGYGVTGPPASSRLRRASASQGLRRDGGQARMDPPSRCYGVTGGRIADGYCSGGETEFRGHGALIRALPIAHPSGFGPSCAASRGLASQTDFRNEGAASVTTGGLFHCNGGIVHRIKRYG